jgi:tyrocidine synthetase-3
MSKAEQEIFPAVLVGDNLEKEKAYWTIKLSGDPVLTGLPLDFRRPTTLSSEKEVVPLEISGEQGARLLTICGGKPSLVLTFLVTVLNVCLHKYTGAEDIIVGTPIHNEHKEIASLNKVLALRAQLSVSQTLKQLLEQTRQTLSEAYAHQKFPFEKILELLNITPASNREALFNVVILLDNINSVEHIGHLKNDVTLIFSSGANNLTGRIEYNSQLFDRKSLFLFAEHYKAVLQAILENATTRIEELRLLTAETEKKLIHDFNVTQRHYPSHKTIHSLFEEQAEKTPQEVAAVFRTRRWTYNKLNCWANQMAHYLQSLGIGPGKRVAICLEHSLEAVGALLGVLKAGAAYVPFDPAHPKSRLSFMLSDAEVPLIITEKCLLEKLPTTDCIKVCVDADKKAIEQQAWTNLQSNATAEDIAYVMYTSGSTGEPKGVIIQHRALVNYVWWAKDVYNFNERVSVALYSSLSFDLTVTSIYPPLITGNKIFIYRQDGRESPLAEIIKDNQVDILKLTPSHLSLIKDQDNSKCKIKKLIVGGEALETELARRTCESFGRKVEIFNEYGPTEATVGCMIYQYDPSVDQRAYVPIGCPAANTQIYLLNDSLTPVAENMIGELFIAGACLAQGYLNRAALTEEKFITNPFSPEQKMYRSGDLARWLSEGGLEFIGRKDNQIKFHGYRVELNDIRCCLNRHPQIRDSLVTITKDRHGQDVMIAYYISRQELDVGELRVFLAESVMEEMLPNVFVHLRKLPLTLNGKVNYRALPTLDEAKERIKRAYVPPQTDTERALVRIWAEALGIEKLGIHDNFFELGGHSLLATLIVSRVRESFQVDLPLRNLLETPTVAGVASYIEAIRWAAQGLQSSCLVPAAAGENYEEGLL